MLPLSLGGFALLGFLVNKMWFYAGLGVSDDFALLDHWHSNRRIYSPLACCYSVWYCHFCSFYADFSLQSRKDDLKPTHLRSKNSNGQDLIDALVAMYHDNASFVGTDPWYSRFYDSHPPAVIRVAHFYPKSANNGLCIMSKTTTLVRIVATTVINISAC